MYNTIHTLRDSQGNWLENREQDVSLLSMHFKSIYTSSSPCSADIDDVLQDIKPIITADLNAKLVEIPSVEEIHSTVNSMAPWKSPGPDGFPGGFFRDNWDMVSAEVINHVQGFFRSKFLLKQLNHSFIALIPKVSNPSTPNDFLPISLTNTVYKIISKILTNRLKPLLDSLILPYQSAFTANRQIHDNIIISHEILHSFKTMKRKNNKDGFMAIKLDLSKAFDRLEWSFIMSVFKKLGFSIDWCQMIFQCISTISCSILVNGSPGDVFFPTRGIRQGHCLSPCIFIICMEALSQFLLKGEKENVIQGFKLRKDSPPISHLFFADDCMLFSKASLTYARNLMRIINKFAKASGQAINLEKSGFFTSRKMHHKHIKMLLKTLGSSSEKYLGTPIELSGGLKRIQEEGYFRSWGDIGKSKLNGGLGIRNTYATNRVLIAKLGWRICKNPDQLVAIFLKNKYFPNQNILEIDKAANTSSWIWKGIVNSLVFLRANLVYKINDGSITRIWEHNWLPGSSSPPTSTNPNFGNYIYVSELIDRQVNGWNIGLLSSLFSHEDVKKIRTLKINVTKKDDIMWAHTLNGNFTVKSAYKAYMNESYSTDDASFWKKVWSLDCLSKIKFFVWKIFSHMLPVNSVLKFYNPAIDDCCPLCRKEVETVMHLFIQCPIASHIWFALSFQHLVNSAFVWIDDIFMSWFENNLGNSPCAVNCPSIGAIVLWSIWKLRCDVVFRNEQVSLDRTIMDIKTSLNTYITAPCSFKMDATSVNKFTIQDFDYIMFIDGSFKKFDMGIGIMLCDNAGRIKRCRADFGLTSSAFAQRQRR
ncbi:uncharacterized protein LOC113305730 [Papaver somniferum]|uniref:uncharacterized protein LOC113305730 n=1 Tax=Papaver somniferum TaxID=3469 RepID=UPI000E703D8E|nr:uncharacterized protein LOC113305730 [Papaver somniferum]